MTIQGQDVQVQHVPLDEPAGDPATYLYRSYNFIANANDPSLGLNPDERKKMLVQAMMIQQQLGGQNQAAINATVDMENRRITHTA